MKVFPYFSKPVKFLIAIRTHPVVWLVILFACACTTEPTGGPLIRVILTDLPADAIYLVMDPTGDETVPDESLRLTGPDRRGVWHIPVRKLTGKFDSPVDTLLIRFSAWHDGNSITSDDPTRRVPLSYLIDHQPVFTYGEPWLPGRVVPDVFRVNMANQQVLGFFDPELGDRVFVTGPWYDWPGQGREMHPARGDMGVWELETEIRYLQDEPPGYRYRIESSRDVVLPNRGYESTGPRRLTAADSPHPKGGTDWFNGQRHVARFVIDEGTLTMRPTPDTLLRIRMEMDGRIIISDVLFPVGQGLWETALMVPEYVEVFSWVVIHADGSKITKDKIEKTGPEGIKIRSIDLDVSFNPSL